MNQTQSISHRILKGGFILCLSFFLVFSLKAENKNPAASHEEDGKAKIQVALLLDTSNSMDGLIEQAKSQLWSIINKLSEAQYQDKQPQLEIALYEYGNDNLSLYNGYVRQLTPFINDLDDLSEKLFSLKTNGGKEYCGKVINTSLDDLYWGNNDNDLKLIFIAGNESFNQGPITLSKSAHKAKNKSVTINTIYCGDFEQGISLNWKTAAQISGGKYMSIDHNAKTEYIASPYDDQIADQNIILNETYVPYGDKGYKKLKNQTTQNNNASGYGKVNSVQRAVSKSSSNYQNSTWDLVDAQKDKNFKLETVDKAQLPQEIQEYTKEDLQEYLEEKRTARKEIQKEINTLNQKRLSYVKEQKKIQNNTNNLEDVLIEAIETQANQKGYIIK